MRGAVIAHVMTLAAVLALASCSEDRSSEQCIDPDPVPVDATDLFSVPGLATFEPRDLSHALVVVPRVPVSAGVTGAPDTNALLTLAELKTGYGAAFVGYPDERTVVIAFESETDMDRAACYLSGAQSVWLIDGVARAVVSE